MILPYWSNSSRQIAITLVCSAQRKIRQYVVELTGKGIGIEDETIRKIYGPVGLDIGAETSEEIAVSIIAEIKAVFSKRNGASLKERKCRNS